MGENYEKLGCLIDDLESLYEGLKIPMSAEFHLKMLKEILPGKIREFKEVYVNITNDNPWD